MENEKFKSYLSKKRLTLPELNKEEVRWNVFLNKLKNNKPFITHPYGEVIVENSKEIIEQITFKNGKLNILNAFNYIKPNNRYAPVLKTNKGEFKLNDFRKTVEFGGGAGTSLGTVNVRIHETTQAFFFAFRQYLKRNITEDDVSFMYMVLSDEVSNEKIKKIRKKLFRDVKSTKYISTSDLKYFEDRGWGYTYIKTANDFYNTLNPNKHYSFYHAFSGIGISDEIYNAFSRCLKPINKENGITVNMSKWNPSDIWVVDRDLEEDIIELLKEVDDIDMLNVLMDSLFDSKHLVGISLKKIPYGKNIELIVSKNLNTKFVYDYSSASMGEFDTLTVKLHAKSYSWLSNKRKEVLDTRIYSGKIPRNIFVEVEGSISKYGKANFNFINMIIKKADLEPIIDYKDIIMTDQQLKNEIIKLYKRIPGLKKNETITSKFRIDDTRSKLISKYQSLLLVELLEKNKKNPYRKDLFNKIKFIFNKKNSVTNYIIKNLFYYAYSMGGDLFGNTKFYRIRTID